MVKVTSGRSDIDRITFSNSKLKSTAIQMADDEIRIEYEEEKKNGIFEIIVGLVLLAIIFMGEMRLIIPFVMKSSLRGYIFYLIPTVFYFMISFVAIKELKKKKNENTRKNHGAEHMVFKAYRKLKRIPTVSEVRKFPRINSYCGINMFSAIITVNLIAICVYYCTGYVVSEILILTIAPMFGKFFPLNVMGNIAQFWTTAEPEDSNIKLAIEALEGLEERVLLKEKN